MRKYVLGMDGGGTKTHCALFDTDGNKVDMIDNWGTTNHECLRDGFSGLKKELDSIITLILSRNNADISQLASCVFGLSGVDTLKQHSIISGLIRQLGINNFLLCNDAYLGIKAGIGEGFGICHINGSGCTAAGIDQKGNMLQIGGLGDITGDTGGGGYLGMRAISTVYASLYRDAGATLMTGKLFDVLGINSRNDFVDALTEAINAGKLRIKELNKIVFSAANDGDRMAVDILEHMGLENARSINGLIKSLDFDPASPINIVLAGSIYVKGENPAAVNRLKQEVYEKNHDRQINIKLLSYPPVAGAVVWAFRELTPAAEAYLKITEAFC